MSPQRSSIEVASVASKIRLRMVQLHLYRHFFKYSLLAAALGVVSAAPVLAATTEPSPLVEPASREHHVGKVIFVELVTPDLAAAKQFYAGLLGWTFRDFQGGGREYAEASLDGRPVAELIHKDVRAGEHKQPAWLSFIAVRDVDAAKRIALQHSAKVLFEPHNFPNRGRQAVFADPQGAVFAVLASSSGDPPDVLAAPGEWIWSSLITSEPDTDAVERVVLIVVRPDPDRSITQPKKSPYVFECKTHGSHSFCCWSSPAQYTR